MLNGLNVLALIPARGGSKRLPRKNILPFNGKPLIAWTIEAALSSKYIDRTIISTDCNNIANTALKFGAEVPFIRPSELAGDMSSTNDVILHAAKELGAFQNNDIIVVLQPTSPLRSVHNIDSALELLIEKSADGIISVCKCEHSPLWANTLPGSGCMAEFINKGGLNKRSQELPTYFRLNGAIYAFTSESLLTHNGIHYSKDVFAYVMAIENSVDIDNEFDFQFASFQIARKSD